MKIKQRYICDFCHTEYENEEKCLACESFHRLIDGSKEVRAIYEKNHEYPTEVIIPMTDGLEIVYYSRSVF